MKPLLRLRHDSSIAPWLNGVIWDSRHVTCADGRASSRTRTAGSTMVDIVSSVFSRGPVVIFGAARMGRAFLDTLRSNGVEVAAFGDNAQEKWGAEIEGVNVVDPDTLRARHRTTPVLIASLL